MPRKTRRQKKKATKRRTQISKKQALISKSIEKKETEVKTTSQRVTKTTPNKILEKETPMQESNPLAHFLKIDLLKALGISFFILAIQFFLYFSQGQIDFIVNGF